MPVPRFGPAELKIMHVLWEKGRATAREITETMNESDRTAHSTVQTLLRNLEGKGAVGHEVEERTFIYRPLVQPEQVKRKVTRECIDRLFGGSPGGLVAYLLQHEHIPRKELEQFRQMIEESEKARGR